ncbi:hypothetical protein HYY74_01145 [Candidatus Woesearchaeota archaeon]|nr:hypothetical protein [Candidatus Woesearchaeota archaeon]
MTVTTVKIRNETKTSLDEIKSDRETYDEVIAKLVSSAKKKNLKDELIAGYKAIGKDELETLKDWDSASADSD